MPEETLSVIRSVDLSSHNKPLSGSAKKAHDWLVQAGPSALPKLRSASRKLIDKHVAYSEYLQSGPSANPMENYGRRSYSERAYRYVIEIQQSRIIDVIEAIEKR